MTGSAKSEGIIRAAQARAGYFRRTDQMCRMARIPLSTFNKRIRSGVWSTDELTRLDRVIHFTDEEIIGFIRRKT